MLPFVLPPGFEGRVDDLLRALDGLESREAIALLAGVLGREMERLPRHEQAYAWFAVTESLFEGRSGREGLQ